MSKEKNTVILDLDEYMEMKKLYDSILDDGFIIRKRYSPHYSTTIYGDIGDLKGEFEKIEENYEKSLQSLSEKYSELSSANQTLKKMSNDLLQENSDLWETTRELTTENRDKAVWIGLLTFVIILELIFIIFEVTI